MRAYMIIECVHVKRYKQLHISTECSTSTVHLVDRTTLSTVCYDVYLLLYNRKKRMRKTSWTRTRIEISPTVESQVWLAFLCQKSDLPDSQTASDAPLIHALLPSGLCSSQ
jgi:hypothetical protein